MQPFGGCLGGNGEEENREILIFMSDIPDYLTFFLGIEIISTIIKGHL